VGEWRSGGVEEWGSGGRKYINYFYFSVLVPLIIFSYSRK
jgi:hypothetical protein